MGEGSSEERPHSGPWQFLLTGQWVGWYPGWDGSSGSMVCHVPCYPGSVHGHLVSHPYPVFCVCSRPAVSQYPVAAHTYCITVSVSESGHGFMLLLVTPRLQCRLWLSHNHLKAQLGEDLLLNWCGVGQILFLTVCWWRPPSAPGHVGPFNVATSFIRASSCTSVYCWVANHPTRSGLKQHSFLATVFLVTWVQLGSLLRVPQAAVKVWWGWTPTWRFQKESSSRLTQALQNPCP